MPLNKHVERYTLYTFGTLIACVALTEGRSAAES